MQFIYYTSDGRFANIYHGIQYLTNIGTFLLRDLKFHGMFQIVNEFIDIMLRLTYNVHREIYVSSFRKYTARREERRSKTQQVDYLPFLSGKFVSEIRRIRT